MNALQTLRMTISNDLRGFYIEESDWAEGFILRDAPNGVALYTAYVSPNGFSAYCAISDDSGYDLADEKLLAANVLVYSAVAKIKAHQIANGDNAYTNDSDRIDTDFRSIDCWHY